MQGAGPEGQRPGDAPGEYREIVPGRRIVHAEVYEGFPDGEALTAVDLDERDGVTT